MKKLPRVAFVLFAFVALVFVADLIRERIAGATSQPILLDKKVCTGTAASGGGTFTCDYAVPTDKAIHIVADVGMTALDAGHLYGAAGFSCDYVVENNNGMLNVPTAATTNSQLGANPVPAMPTGTATTLRSHFTERAEGVDGLFYNSGSGTSSTCTWSISSTNARVTVTDTGTVGADVTVYVTAFVFGSQ